MPARQRMVPRDETGEGASRSRPGKVLLFAPSLGDGGAQTHLVRLANAFTPDQFDVRVVVGRPGGVHEASLAPRIRLDALSQSNRSWWPTDVVTWPLPLRRVISEAAPDVVYSVLDHANCAALLAVRGMNRRPKMVVGVQTPVGIHYGHLPFPKHVYALTWIKKLYPLADMIVACSQGAADDLSRVLPEVGDRVRVIHNCIELPTGTVTRPPRRDAIPRVVACGRLTEQKGFEHLIRAMVMVRQQCPAELTILGEGELRGKLERIVAESGLAGYVHLPGFSHRILEDIASADVFVLPSIWEAFGNVIVEAMSCGTPVVAADCPYGPSEIIESGVNGLLVPPGNEQRLASAVVEVLENRELGDRLAQAGLRRAKDFMSSAITQKYERLFASLVA